MALDFFTGFEHGLSSLAGDNVGGTPSVQSTVARTGTYALQCNSSGTNQYVERHFSSANAVVMASASFYFDTVVATDSINFMEFNLTGGGQVVLKRNQNGKLFTVFWSGSADVSPIETTYALALQRWYWIQMLANVSANPWTLDVRVMDDAGSITTIPQNTGALAATTATSALYGVSNGGVTGNTYIDDVALYINAISDGDYPQTARTYVQSYSPTGVGTHNLDASTSQYFFANAGSDTALTTSETTSYQRIDDVPLDADSEYIKVVSTAAGFPTIPTSGTTALTAVQANTTATRTFPNLSSLTKNSGDLLIAIVVGYQSSAASGYFSGWTAGWTEFGDVGTSSSMCIGAAYKWSTGSETGTITVTQAGTITGHAAMILMAIPGAHGTTPPELGSYASGTPPNPAAFDPAGWGTEDTLWIAVRGNGETATTGSFTGLSTAPTNFTGPIQTGITSDVVGGIEAGVSFLQQTAASQDIDGGSMDTSNARGAAAVIAVRPATTSSSPANTLYAEHTIADSTEVGVPTALRAYARTGQGSATASDLTVKLCNTVDAAESNIVALAANTSTSSLYTTAVFTQAPGSVAWTSARFNGLTIRTGYTASASGAPRLESALFEVLYPVTAAPPAVIPDVNFATIIAY